MIGGFFDDVTDALKGAVKSVASFVKRPPSWFAAAFPLFTMENQRYWAGKLGGSTGEKLYDAGVIAVATKYLGPQGPQLVEAYNKVTEDAAKGNLNAREILAKAPEIARLAAASKQGPDAFRAAVTATKSTPNVSGDEGEEEMSAHYVGQDTSWRARASEAVNNAAQARAANLYAFSVSRYRDPVTSELKFGQKVLLFDAFDQARSWFDAVAASPNLNYVAVFNRANLATPIMEQPSAVEPLAVSGYGSAEVGNVWPFFLGLPLGGAAGYFLRRWQEPPASRAQVTPLRDVVRPLLPGGGAAVPGGTTPTVGYPWLDFVGQEYAGGYDPSLDFVGCDPSVGNEPWLDIVGNEPWMNIVGNEPWLDIVGNELVGCGDGYSVGGPWVEFAPWIGAQVDDAASRQASAQARALIQSAIRDIAEYTPSMPPANYYVWWLAAPTASSSRRNVAFGPSPQIVSFTSLDEAKDHVRSIGQQSDVIARAVFDKTSPHWPSPVAWSKGSNPAFLPMIAQYVTDRASPTTTGQYVDSDYIEHMVGATADEMKLENAKRDLRARARLLAQKRAGDAVGVIHTVKDNLWHALAFDTPDDADDWLNTATQDQNTYTYAAYFDKRGDSWPAPYIEKFGGYAGSAPGPRPRRAPIVGATRAEMDTLRARAKARASATTGRAVVVVITADNLEHASAFRSLDEAIDGLNRGTSLGKSNYAYIAAFDKGTTGEAYVQAEEWGDASVPVPSQAFSRDRPATTSGEW